MAELERIPVDYAQGFLLARPQPVAGLLGTKAGQ
jgi:EAL domain-containing protein (putative c-di-GMP-specific phosphodiesterase class I)